MDKHVQIKNEYLHLMKLYFEVGNSIKGDSLNNQDKWLYDSEILITKLFNHISTLLYLSDGTTFTLPNDRQRICFDHSSISVVVRAAFETFLTYYYLFCDRSSNTDVKKFRHIIWKVSGLKDRQSFKLVRKENLSKLEVEKIIFDDLIVQVENNSIFSTLNAKAKKAVKEGKWRYQKSWADLSDIAGFNKKVFIDIYSYLCSYAHSGGLSALQIGQAVNIIDQKELTTISCQYGLILMSHFIFSYIELFPRAKTFFNNNKDRMDLAFKWNITWKEEEFIKTFAHNNLLNTD